MVLQCKGGRGEESQATAVEEDDNGEGSGARVRVRVCGNKEAEPDWQLMVPSVRVFHGRTKELESNGLFLCVWVRATKLKKG